MPLEMSGRLLIKVIMTASIQVMESWLYYKIEANTKTCVQPKEVRLMQLKCKAAQFSSKCSLMLLNPPERRSGRTRENYRR